MSGLVWFWSFSLCLIVLTSFNVLRNSSIITTRNKPCCKENKHYLLEREREGEIHVVRVGELSE